MSEHSNGSPPSKRNERMLVATMILSLFLQAEPAISATLKGSASFSAHEANVGHAYYPASRTIARANALAHAYKLDAAEAIYRGILAKDPKNAAAHNGMGLVNYYRTTSSNQNRRNDTRGLYEAAIDHFMKALAYQPNYIEARLNLGMIYLEQDRLAEAGEMISNAWQMAPHDAYANECLGNLKFRQGQYDDAMPYFKTAIELQSGNGGAYAMLGAIYTQRGQYDEAHRALQNAIYLDPDNAPAHHYLGVLYDEQGNGAAAVNEYKKAVRLKPEYLEPALKLAHVYEQRGDWALALEQYKNALASESNFRKMDWPLYERIGKISIRNRQPEIATHYYQRWLKDHPGDPRALKAISDSQTQVAKLEMNEHDLAGQGAAKQAVDQAVLFSPDNFEAKLIQTRLDEAIGKPKFKTDTNMLDVALQTQDFRPGQSFAAGEAYLERYQFSKAEGVFRTAMRSSKTPRDYLNFGTLMLVKGMPNLAEEAFNVVLAKYPDHNAALIGRNRARKAVEESDALFADAKFNRKKNYDPKAVWSAQEALKLNARNDKAHYFLGEMFEDAKDYASAADHYFAYVQLNPVSEDREKVERKIERLKEKLAKAQR